jgi:PPM family protein phosphatase
MKLRHSARTDVGRTRDHNEDNFGVGESPDTETLGYLFVVCDGMGGHASGEVASSIGVERIISSYYETPGDDRAMILEQAFERANLWIHEEGQGSMGTTGVAALIYHDLLYVANVGDSRAYLLRRGVLQQVSRDHSLVGDQVAAGLITPEQARSIHYRNVITRALGYQPEVNVDVFHWPLAVGDMIVLSSDGLHGLVEDHELAETLAAEPLNTAVDTLIALANQRGGTDNITLVVVVVDELNNGDAAYQSSALFNNDDPEAVTQPNPAALPAEWSDDTTYLQPIESTLAAPVSLTPIADTPATPARERRLGFPGLMLAILLFAILFGIYAIAPQQVQAPAPVTPGLVATLTPATTPVSTPSASPAASPAITSVTTPAILSTPVATPTP